MPQLKADLKMLTRNIASEYGAANIQCNGIGPGYIATPQTAPLATPGNPFNSFILAKTPANRWGTPEDLEGPAVFLASDASNFVNGHILYVDGGILSLYRQSSPDKAKLFCHAVPCKKLLDFCQQRW
jgi:gluconate 5-dehydrogenase